ncbi:thioredoxin domain-containing protein [Candidatus Uhrbacteria bacterium]|nr:thioredoxin domain-containing protein [Candidatus Uhrbacteria bacterium]
MPRRVAAEPLPASLEGTRAKKPFPWATLVVLLVMAGVGGFVWRIAHFANLIQRGELNPYETQFAQDMTVSRLAASASAVTPNVDVAGSPDDPWLGSADAPLTIVEFADFGCPYSRQASFLMRSLAHEYGDRVRYVYRDFPLVDVHPEAGFAAEAAGCAGAQGKFWEYHDKLYQAADDFSRDRLIEHARSLGLDTGPFIACLDRGLTRDDVQADYEDGLEAGVYGTPTFFFNGRKIDGAIPADVLRQLIETFSKTPGV